MKNRKEILSDFPEKLHTKIEDLLDEIQYEVDEAKDILTDIGDIEDLHKIVECRDHLKELSNLIN